MPTLAVSLVAALVLVAVIAYCRNRAWRNRSRAHGRRIVVFAEGTPPKEGKRLIRSMGGRVVRQLPGINGALCELGAVADAQAWAAHDKVAWVDDDLEVQAYCRGMFRKKAEAEAVAEVVPWGVERIAAPQVWKQTPPVTGSAVKVAVLDTGADLRHPDLYPNLAAGVNIIEPRRQPIDDHGHGTHVTGSLAAAWNGTGVVGAAPKARIYPVKVLDRNGSGRLSDIVRGLDWCINQGIKVVNMSLGSPEGNATFQAAVARAVAAGIVIVAAAGNSGPGPNSTGYPARYPDVIGVAATTMSNSIAGFSSRGEGVDIAAPGDKIPSTWLSGGYTTLSGTSMAAPHVAGVAALLLSREPGLTPAQTLQRLKATATPLPGWPIEAQGAGLVNAPRAVQDGR